MSLSTNIGGGGDGISSSVQSLRCGDEFEGVGRSSTLMEKLDILDATDS